MPDDFDRDAKQHRSGEPPLRLSAGCGPHSMDNQSLSATAAEVGPHSSAMRNPLVMLLAAVVMVPGCSRAPVITIANQSSVTLSNLVVSGSGFSDRVGEIAPGRQRKLTVCPSGESGVRVVFDAGSQHIDTGEQDYFEAGGGYRVAVTVQPDLKVSVSSDLRGY